MRLKRISGSSTEELGRPWTALSEGRLLDEETQSISSPSSEHIGNAGRIDFLEHKTIANG